MMNFLLNFNQFPLMHTSSGRGILIVILIFIIFTLTSAQTSICVQHESCGRCLSADVACAWCTDRQYDMRKSRCMIKIDLQAANCASIYENRNDSISMVMDKPHHDFNTGSLDAIQMRPQKVALTLRKWQTKTINMTYRPAKHYPLDLYCLMDMTRSMTDDKETLVSVGKDLAYTLQNLTESYRIGFGSFVDKPAMPFMPIGRSKDNPCALEHEVCEKTYGFRHRLSLTSNVTEFVDIVNATGISANLDNLEGGLDALMQVIVCSDNIGWRKQSRKIVIFASDGLIHFAGDGLLAGVVRKNDKQCYLSEDGEYMASLQLDYPSLEEIYRELLRRKVNIIFAVTQEVQKLYKQLHSLMADVSSVGVLKMDSSNIIQLVDIGYKDFAKRIQFTDNAPDHLRITYETRCGNLYSTPKKQSKCDNIEIGNDYEFLINVTLIEYPVDGHRMDSFKIEEGSLSSENLEVTVTMENECPCVDEETGEMESVACNFHGEMKCGMCNCDSGWSGKTCECDLMNYGSSKELEHQCRVPIVDYGNENVTKLGPICADRGECSCGQCYCNIGFNGKYCDCNECPYFQGEACGGPEHGVCDCGQCICKPNWTGDRCDCLTATATCIAPHESIECSQHGVCRCGKCECLDNYFGSFCETSSSAGSALCQYYEPCVKCLLEQREGMKCIDVAARCTSKDGNQFQTEFQDDIANASIQCLVRITSKQGQQCDHYFSYHVDSNAISHLYIVDHECPVFNAGFAVVSIMLATFLIGCFVIVFIKCHNIIQDKREFARFEEEQRQMTKYEFESPIYNSPVRRYEIPKCLSNEQHEMNSL